jgi:hypothetical protein
MACTSDPKQRVNQQGELRYSKFCFANKTYVVYVEKEGVVDVLRGRDIRDPIEFVYKEKPQINNQ